MLQFEEVYPELAAKRQMLERDQHATVEWSGDLRAQLALALERRAAVDAQLAAYLELSRKLQVVQDSQLPTLKTMVNLGNDFYAQAEVPDTSFVFVNVGMGFYPEMTPSEAQTFISAREAELSRQVEMFTKKIADIKMRLALHHHQPTSSPH